MIVNSFFKFLFAELNLKSIHLIFIKEINLIPIYGKTKSIAFLKLIKIFLQESQR